MRRIRLGAYLASTASALYLIRLALRSAFGQPGPVRSRGPISIIILLIVGVAVGGYVLYLMFSGPRMRVQPKLRPYQALMPALPQGTIPVSPAGALPPAAGPDLPADTERTRRIGQAHYANYCGFCHGKTGRGDGPVGQSYVPVPTDLTSPAVQDLSDDELHRRMLTGVGHAPVLEHVVDPNAPRYIVPYVRSLGGKE